MVRRGHKATGWGWSWSLILQDQPEGWEPSTVESGRGEQEEEMMGMLQLVSFIETCEELDGKQKKCSSPWHTPNLPERLERNIQQKIKKKNIKQQQRENKLVFLFLLCNMVWLDEEEERCVRVFPEWTRSNRGVHDRRRRQHQIQNTVDVKLVV